MKKLLFFACLALLLTACGGNPGSSPTSASQAAPAVNGFGTAANHVHSMLILPDANRTLVLATHYGIFRSQDHGATWQETAAGPNQLMQGLMTYSLSYNTLDPQRLYVLTQIATVPYKGILGLYTSGDSGKTWHLSITDASITASSIFFAQAGNDNPDEVYIYLRELGALGLRVSMDNGLHFSQAGGTLPFSSLLGLLVVPGEPGHLLAYGDGGIANTTDGGYHWQVVKNIQGSIFEMTTPGAGNVIYASGDAGIYASRDSGKSFKLVYTQHSYSSLSASPQQPEVLYGKLGLGVYRSADGGQSWSKLPAIKGNLQVLIADPGDTEQVYLAISYPSEVYHFQAERKAWQSITPPAA
ncbi:MAG TPA: sialidase family protein [Ktedonobacteraceae bacterium]|nr:sialidase family protein [Ktedonobacteraceae bacterium]